MHPPGDAIVPLDVCRAGPGNASFFLSEVMRVEPAHDQRNFKSPIGGHG
jgi:hypothetical protein